MTVEIRQASLSDDVALTACIAAAYAPYIASGLQLPPVADGVADDIRDHSVWVATKNDLLLGGVVLVLGKTAHLANLAVHPDAGGLGIGRALVAQAMKVAKAEGFSQLHLTTHAAMAQTLAFYRRLGWVDAERDGDKVYFQIEL